MRNPKPPTGGWFSGAYVKAIPMGCENHPRIFKPWQVKEYLLGVHGSDRKYILSWFIIYLRDLQPTYVGMK